MKPSKSPGKEKKSWATKSKKIAKKNAQTAECKVNSLPHPLTVCPAYIYLHHPHNLNLNNLIGQLKGVKKTSSFFKSFFKIKSDVLS